MQWRRSDVQDLGIALVVAVFGVVGTVRPGADEPHTADVGLGAVLLVALAALAMSARRRAPLTVQLVVSAAVAVYLALDYPFGPILGILTFAIASAATQAEPRRSLAVTGVSLLLAAAAAFARPGLSFLWVAWFVAPWAIGALVRTRGESRRRDRAELERRRAYDERLRIAQEVHDVVGHGLSVIAMQAGVALHVLERRPDDVRASLEAIRDTSTQALDGLRETLALLRDEGQSAELQPVGSLADLDRLVAGVRAGGLDVDLRTTGEARLLPTGVDHAAFRIIQESLTNVVRHAQAAQVTVRLTYAASSLDVEVADDGQGSAGDVEGEGVAGMRERALALAGSFEVHTAPGRGVAVRASLPLDRS